MYVLDCAGNAIRKFDARKINIFSNYFPFVFLFERGTFSILTFLLFYNAANATILMNSKSEQNKVPLIISSLIISDTFMKLVLSGFMDFAYE